MSGSFPQNGIENGNPGQGRPETRHQKGMETMLKLNSFGLFVNDINTMVAFYRDVMHMTTDWDGGPFAALHSEDINAALIMFSRKDFEQMTAQAYGYPRGLNGTLELSFDVGETGRVDEEYARTVAAGAKPVYPPTDEPWGQRTCYVADPDGNLIEISAFMKKD